MFVKFGLLTLSFVGDVLSKPVTSQDAVDVSTAHMFTLVIATVCVCSRCTNRVNYAKRACGSLPCSNPRLGEVANIEEGMF